MKPTPLIILSVVCLSVLVSCSNPINAYTGSRYYEAGEQAERAGDLQLARQNFHRAYINAQIGNVGPAAEAYALYDWSRVTGYLGMHAESQKGFSAVLALIPKAKGEADKLLAPALSEYARLLHDTGQHSKAVTIYEKAVAELEKNKILTIDPMGFASLLDDYAGSLAAAGFSERSAGITTRSTSIKEMHKGTRATFKARRYKT
jgi:tetratricopeptide (TPR) repeat protein